MTDALFCPIKKALPRFGEQIALTDGQESLTYRQLDAAIDRIASALAARGITAGDTIAFPGNNSIRQAVFFFACHRYGFVFLPLNLRLKPAEWTAQMQQSRARLLVSDGKYRADSEAIPEVIADEFFAAVSADAVIHPAEGDAEVLILFSSGSSGRPHGVVFSRSGLHFSARGANEGVKLESSDVWLAVLPFFHAGGLSILMRAAHAGGAVFVADRFDPNQIIALAASSKISIVSLVPTMLRGLMTGDDKNDLRFLKAIVMGGAAWDRAVVSMAAERRLPLYTTYGLTETASMVTLSAPGECFTFEGSAGRVLPFRRLKIVGDDGRILPAGQEGKLLVGGEVLYARDLDGCRPGDWFDGGDIGRLDEAGRLYVTGRRDRIVASGGEKINLEQVEASILEIAGVSGAAVLSRPDTRWGERPVAFVEVSASSLSASDVGRQLKAKLPRFMIPDEIIMVDRLPQTGSGKYDRLALKEKYPQIFK